MIFDLAFNDNNVKAKDYGNELPPHTTFLTANPFVDIASLF